MPVQLPESVERPLRLVKVDFEPEHRQPAAILVVAATVVALVGSLLADAILAKLGQTVFPSTKGYVHFHFGDYAKLTVIGVIIACAAWPIVTRISSDPRWLFFRQAIAVTLVLWLPDLWLLYKGQPGEAVAVLMLMHVAIALVTYNALVHIAKVQPADGPGRRAAQGGRRARGDEAEDYGYEDYGRSGYARENYGRENYGRDDYFPGDRRLEPARRQFGQREPDDAYQPGYREPDDAYRAGYREADPRQPGGGYAEPDGRYQASHRQPSNWGQASGRQPDDRYQASRRQPEDWGQGGYSDPGDRPGGRSARPDDPYDSYFR